MKRLIAILFTCLYLLSAAQTDTTVFSSINTIETNEYTFQVPDKWRNVPQIDAASRDQKFEFTDVALPHIINNAPLTAIFILRKVEGEKRADGENFIVTEFTSYPDRIAPAGYTYETDSIKIGSGETATLLTTHYYRRSKASNFTRYDLVAYSDKRKANYLLTITYQYKDPTYAIEFNLKLKEYAKRIFKTLVLR